MTNNTPDKPASGAPLESWKEIAAYLQRDERTARRWEKDEGLPVHRHHHLSRSSVYAYPSELDAWRVNRKPATESTRSIWWRPVPAFASTIGIALALMMSGSGPRVGAVVQAADGIVTRQLWAGPGVGLEGSVSPDGRYLTFADWTNAFGELALRDLNTGESRHLTDDGGDTPRSLWANRSVFSPDGRQVAYSWFNADKFYELRTIGLEGSRPRVLYRSGAGWSVEPMAWHPDGKSIVAWQYPAWPPGSSQIVAVSTANGTLKVLRSLRGQVPTRMSLSPDGRYLAYDISPDSESTTHDIFRLATDGGSETALIEHPANDHLLDWTPDGSGILFASDRTGDWDAWLIAVSEGKPRGDPRVIKSHTGEIRPLGFSGKGAFYYGLGGWTYDVYTVGVDLTAGKILSPPALAVQRFQGSNRGASYSIDGESFAYASRRTPASKTAAAILVCIRDLRSGRERELSPELNWFDPPQWSHDGKSIYYVRYDSRGQRCRVLLRNLGTGTDRAVVQIEGKNTRFIDLALAPDGLRLAASLWDDDRKQTRLVVLPAAGGAMTELLRESGAEPIRRLAWTPDARQLLFVRRTHAPPGQRRAEVWRIPAEGGSPQSLGLSMREIDRLAVHPDGRQVTFSASELRAEVWVMENILPAGTPAR